MGNPAFDSLKKKPEDEDEDTPPGAAPYSSGPLAMLPPKPVPPPKPPKP